MIPTTRLKFTPKMDIRNLDAMPRGTGAKFLVAIRSHEPGVFIAKRWARSKPMIYRKGEVSIAF